MPESVVALEKTTPAAPPVRYDYHGYTIDNVYGAVPDDLRGEIVEMWLRNGVIPSRQVAERRVDQVVLAIRNPDGQMAGVSTAYVGDFQQAGNRYFFYRMFIQPADRITNLMRFVTLRTADILQAHHVPGGPQGMLIVTENQKLMRQGMKSMFERNGFEYFGRDHRGLDIWRWKF